MEEPSLHGVSNNGDSGNTSRPTGSIAVSDEGGNVDDPPPIPSASSSRYLTEKSVGESRLNDVQNYNENDLNDVHLNAHALTYAAVAHQVGTSIE